MNTASDQPDATSGAEEIAPGVSVAPGGIRLQYARSSGPGGQNVNKLSTKVELWVQLSAIRGLSHRAMERLAALAGGRLTAADELHIRAETERSQQANREDAFQRLRELILKARVEPKIRRRTRPSKASKARRLDSKRRRGQIKSSRRSHGQDD